LLKYYPRRPCAPSFVKSRTLRPLQTHFLLFQQIFFVLVCILLGCLLRFWPLGQNPAGVVKGFFKFKINKAIHWVKRRKQEGVYMPLHEENWEKCLKVCEFLSLIVYFLILVSVLFNIYRYRNFYEIILLRTMGRLGVIPSNMQFFSCILIWCRIYEIQYLHAEKSRKRLAQSESFEYVTQGSILDPGWGFTSVFEHGDFSHFLELGVIVWWVGNYSNEEVRSQRFVKMIWISSGWMCSKCVQFQIEIRRLSVLSFVTKELHC